MDAGAATLGEIELTPLFDGTLLSGLDKIPGEDDRAAAAALLKDAPSDALTMDVFAFLLQGPDGAALIDAGTGTFKGPATGQLGDHLAKAGVSPQSISRIYLTHLHADHFGGLIDGAGAARFPNAELILTEPEAHFWLETAPADMPARARRAAPDAHKAIAPYRERMRVVPKDGSWGGLTAVPSPGHTPGHTCWLISSKGVSALAWGDVVHIPAIHLRRPRTGMDYDLDADLAGETRVQILERVARERILVAGSHLKSPPLAYIRKDGDVYALEPV